MAAAAVGDSGVFSSASLGSSFRYMTFNEHELTRWPAVRPAPPALHRPA